MDYYDTGLDFLLQNSSAVYWIVFIGSAALCWFVQWNLKRKFEKYSKVLGFRGLTGREVAERMLADHGITDVQVVSIAGHLTDHYDPTTHQINLSEDVYNSNSIMAEAVAAHECGHAVQHAVAYGPLELRSKLVPTVSFASKWMQWVLLGGMIMVSCTGNTIVLTIGVILFSLTTLFAFVTLPVEVNASQRAVEWLNNRGYTDSTTLDAAKDALHAAAYTYVAAALSSLGTLFYYILMLLQANRRS